MRYGACLLALASLAFAADPKVELGRRLFMDPTVSRSGRFSCASCHLPEHGFSDPRPFSEDENGKTPRHSQPLLDLAGSNALHWDGEFGSVREILVARLAPPEKAFAAARDARKRRFAEAETEGRKPDKPAFDEALRRFTPPYYGDGSRGRRQVTLTPVDVRLAEDDRYDAAFEQAFGSPEATTDRIVDALDAYVLSLASGESAFDRYRKGDPSATTSEVIRGHALFTGKAGCASCHTIDGERPRFTDGLHHNTGVAFRLDELEFGGTVKGDGGAGEISFVREDLGKFKTPSLRDVARRAPYMHDGSLATLEQVVRYYDRGATANRHLDPRVRPLRLTDLEVKDLVAFLESLTSDERPGLGSAPSSPRRARIRVLDLEGLPRFKFAVVVRPAGDRLGGASAADQTLVTDANGHITFDFPAWTHVRLLAPDHEIHYDWPIPDCVTEMDVTAASRKLVAVRLRLSGGRFPAKVTAGTLVSPPGSTPTPSEEAGILFTRLRMIDPNQAIYVAAATGGEEGRVVATFPSWGTFVVDLSGGWTDPITLRRG